MDRMMLGGVECGGRRRATRKKFLRGMNVAIGWTDRITGVQPYYPGGKHGHPDGAMYHP